MSPIENELDIRQLFLSLWRGRFGIIITSLVFAIGALIYSLLVKPEWVAIVVIDKPSANMLGNYYLRQQLLDNLSLPAVEMRVSSGTADSHIIDSAYTEFGQQANSYDTYKDFWLQSDYYQKQRTESSRENSILLDELINNIQFIAGNSDKHINDNIRLTATTAQDASSLLQQFINYISERTVRLLNKELETQKSTKLTAAQLCIMQLQKAEDAIYSQKLTALEKALQVQKIETFSGKYESESTAFDDNLLQLPATELEARIAILKVSGPEYDKNYYLCELVKKELSNLSDVTYDYKPYRYLRSPEEPIKRNKPRRAFLIVLWGSIGFLFGAGVALIRQRKS